VHIWVDADACPAVIKDILFRAADEFDPSKRGNSPSNVAQFWFLHDLGR